MLCNRKVATSKLLAFVSTQPHRLSWALKSPISKTGGGSWETSERRSECRHEEDGGKYRTECYGLKVEMRHATACSAVLRGSTLYGISLRMRIPAPPYGLWPVGMWGSLDIRICLFVCLLFLRHTSTTWAISAKRSLDIEFVLFKKH